MIRSTVFLTLTAVTLLAASPGYATGSNRKPAKCPPGRSHLIAADAEAQVYLRPGGSGPSGEYQAEEIFGCAYGGRRAYALSGPPAFSSQSGSEATDYTLAGVILVFESFEVQSIPGLGLPELKRLIKVENLRTGRLLHKVPTGTSSPNSIGIGPVVTLVVKSDGAVAWIAGNNKGRGEPATSYEVHALDKTGNRLLASGAEIDPSSLALAGGTLYWTQGGKPMSAVLN
jgi:hypothetical protein